MFNKLEIANLIYFYRREKISFTLDVSSEYNAHVGSEVRNLIASNKNTPVFFKACAMNTELPSYNNTRSSRCIRSKSDWIRDFFYLINS